MSHWRDKSQDVIREAGRFEVQSRSVQSSMLRQQHSRTILDLLHKLEKDTEAWDLFVQIYPALREDLVAYAKLCLQWELWTVAVKLFAFVLRFEESAYCQAAYSDVLFGLKRYKESASAYQTTISLAPTVPNAYISLAEAFMILKEPQEAVNTLQTMLSLDGIQNDPLYELAQQRLQFALAATQR